MDIRCKPWKKREPPKRILAIRLQAMGDVMITLPYLQHVRSVLPESSVIDFLTRKETAEIPRSIILFNKVFAIGGGRNHRTQLLLALLLLPRLMARRYDMVIDLQNNDISRLLRRMLRPQAWSQFDRFSPNAAGERNRLTIESIGLKNIAMKTGFTFKHSARGIQILNHYGWNGTDPLVVLNPAGFFVTRNWPLNFFTEFATLWLSKHPESYFLVLGTTFIEAKAMELKKVMGDRLINLVGKTTPLEAFDILQKASFVLSEDSGLMHMSWVSGIPTVSLFGSTRSDWSRPLGKHTFFFDSSDLPCGNCMSAVCKMGDVRCLTRITPEMAFRQACLLTER